MGGVNACQKGKQKKSSDDQRMKNHAAESTDTATVDGFDKAHQVFDNTPTTYPAGAARAVFESLMNKENGDRVAAKSEPTKNSTQPNDIYPDDAFNYQHTQGAAAGPSFVNRGNIGSQNNTTGDYNRVDARVTGPVTFSRPTTDKYYTPTPP